MARKVSFVPTAPDRGSVAVLPVNSIPAEVKAEVEEIYEALKKNPNGRMRAEFDTKAELDTYMTQVVSYCRQRTVNGVDAPLRFRKSPTKGLPDTTMDYRIGDPVPEKDDTATPATDTTPAASATPAATTEPVATATPVKAAGSKKK